MFTINQQYLRAMSHSDAVEMQCIVQPPALGDHSTGSWPLYWDQATAPVISMVTMVMLYVMARASLRRTNHQGEAIGCKV